MKGKILVLEGTKRSGKTTFGKELISHWNGPVFYISDRSLLEHENCKDASYGYMLGVLTTAREIIEQIPNSLVILDRFQITEYLYGKNRGYNNFYQMKKISLMLNELGAELYLFCSFTWRERIEGTGNHFEFNDYVDTAHKFGIFNYRLLNFDKTEGNISKLSEAEFYV